MSSQTSASKGKIRTYFRGVRAETKKVIWPSKKELINYTGVVILISFMVGLVVWLLDLGIHRLLSLIIK
ncbi:preprotein translocase subunit SecE [Tepidimicrobium xylanilyticum]|uniref:Protein translocase subunit SecE n=1 Tax=Tepidimicrobium xylanilyticum TaxID=1123352 RepID=A0A1H3EV13_9FIRM|nr:preprotein translocase subunit SecE [Tepidimicrobium xylanilyticum]GMG98134.1 protein translocase subunit SecE [Tepidimicrobium xylanilyticum]SDX81928.1 preprotein translocase subunit SecE [Tepidimicrobium xylanilyticum]